jgi:hypothetical protein
MVVLVSVRHPIVRFAALGLPQSLSRWTAPIRTGLSSTNSFAKSVTPTFATRSLLGYYIEITKTFVSLSLFIVDSKMDTFVHAIFLLCAFVCLVCLHRQLFVPENIALLTLEGRSKMPFESLHT